LAAWPIDGIVRTLVNSLSANLSQGYLNLFTGLGGSSRSLNSAATPTATTTAPTAPWQAASTGPQQSALVNAVMHGAAFFDASTAKVNVPNGADAADYKGLFTLYQGINALQGLVH
jgi:hypothetical protein